MPPPKAQLSERETCLTSDDSESIGVYVYDSYGPNSDEETRVSAHNLVSTFYTIWEYNIKLIHLEAKIL